VRKPKKTYYSLLSFSRFIQKNRKGFVLTFLVFLVSTIATSLIPLFIGRLVEAASHPGATNDILFYAWILVVLSSGHDVLWRAGEFLHRRYISPLRFTYETQMFHHVISKPYPYFIDKFSGKISSNISLVCQEFRGLLFDIFYAYIPQIVGLIIMAITLASVNWQTFLIFTFGVIGMIIVGRYTLRNSSFYEARSTDAESTKNGVIIDSIANFASVKSFQKELTELTLVKKKQSHALDMALTAYTWDIAFWASMSLFVRHLVWPIAILLNVYLFTQDAISLGQLTTVLSTILLFASTVWGSVWQMSQLNLRFARAEEAHRYLFGKTIFDATHDQRPKAETNFGQTLELHNLTFAYPDKPDTPTLHNINLAIKKGEKIGVVGKSGGGKTTLVKLLLGYYELDDNSLFIDGKPVAPKDIGRSIAYVPQDTSLFHRSIAENIAYASEDKVTKEAIIKAAKQAHAHEFIMEINGDYDALVGERGIKLSGGQRQRIAIARAILRNAPILILDEATSALDSESEHVIQAALQELMTERTAIVIAHRLSTIQKMDRIIVLDKGKIIEQGTHQELINKKGMYATLWAHQSGGFIEE
jgi:ABC-type multidrug transport system fused ATPase/permease subunit